MAQGGSSARADCRRSASNLQLYRKVLPSLDLKRGNCWGNRRRRSASSRRWRPSSSFKGFPDRVARELPMLGADAVDLEGLVNACGSSAPVMENVVGRQACRCSTRSISRSRDYSLLGKPHWVDLAVEPACASTPSSRPATIVARERVEILIARPCPQDHPARQPLRQDPDPAGRGEHQAHPDLPRRCRARRGRAVEDRQDEGAQTPRGRNWPKNGEATP